MPLSMYPNVYESKKTEQTFGILIPGLYAARSCKAHHGSGISGKILIFAKGPTRGVHH